MASAVAGLRFDSMGADDREGWLRTDPGMMSEQGGMDGFFIARWRAPAQ